MPRPHQTVEPGLQRAFTLLGAGLDFASPGGRWSLQFWGRNLTKVDQFQFGALVPTTQASTFTVVNSGRTLGTTAPYRF